MTVTKKTTTQSWDVDFDDMRKKIVARKYCKELSNKKKLKANKFKNVSSLGL